MIGTSLIKDYDAFAAKYHMNGELNEQTEKIELMYKWCTDAEIVGTSTFFVNGKGCRKHIILMN
ncbi:MAG: hypothetical protein IPN43_05740 [Chitinophagaceae bacterium]|nr:hypothetical protein [Chitinophagaceae bacterium]